VDVSLTINDATVSEMNRIYAGYFSEGRYPARTTTIVAALPSAAFFVEVECEAVLE
jgi:2-iminobutanoate/2-iminopropanoate deaminase